MFPSCAAPSRLPPSAALSLLPFFPFSHFPFFTSLPLLLCTHTLLSFVCTPPLPFLSFLLPPLPQGFRRSSTSDPASRNATLSPEQVFIDSTRFLQRSITAPLVSKVKVCANRYFFVSRGPLITVMRLLHLFHHHHKHSFKPPSFKPSPQALSPWVHLLGRLPFLHDLAQLILPSSHPLA